MIRDAVTSFSYSLIPIQRCRIRDSALLSKGAGTAALPYSADWQLHCTLIPEPFTLNRETRNRD